MGHGAIRPVYTFDVRGPCLCRIMSQLVCRHGTSLGSGCIEPTCTGAQLRYVMYSGFLVDAQQHVAKP